MDGGPGLNRNHNERAKKGPEDSCMMRRLLRVCQKIESQVSSLNRLEQENNRLTTSLNQVEANFHLLLRTSQAEISKLKSALLHNSKSYAHTGNMGRRISTLDPYRVIDRADLIKSLHTSPSQEIPTHRKCNNVSKPSETRIIHQRSPSTSGSSSLSTTSTSSSASSSSASLVPQRVCPHDDHCRRQSTSLASTSRPIDNSLTKGSHIQSNQANVMRTPRNRKQINSCEHPVSTARTDLTSKSASNNPHGEAKLVKQTKVVTTDSSTGAVEGPESHLTRLMRASVRCSREHHSASVKLAPPSRGTILSEKEKAIINAYLQLESERCMAAAAAIKRPRSQSPQRSLPLFAQRQLLKYASLCSQTPPASCDTSQPPRENSLALRTPLDKAVSNVETSANNMENSRISDEVEPNNPEEEDSHNKENREVEQQKVGPNTEVKGMLEGEEKVQLMDTSRPDSPPIDIEEDIIDVNLRFDGEEGEAMSEGEINDEEEDPVEEERINDSSTNRHRSHRHQKVPQACQPSQRSPMCSAIASRYSPPLRHNGVVPRQRRRNSESPGDKFILAKRCRRRSARRDDYSRPRRSSPPRPSHRPAPVTVKATSGRRRFPSTSGVHDFPSHRIRHSTGFVSHRPPPAVYRSSRRSVVPQRQFVSRR